MLDDLLFPENNLRDGPGNIFIFFICQIKLINKLIFLAFFREHRENNLTVLTSLAHCYKLCIDKSGHIYTQVNILFWNKYMVLKLQLQPMYLMQGSKGISHWTIYLYNPQWCLTKFPFSRFQLVVWTLNIMNKPIKIH